MQKRVVALFFLFSMAFGLLGLRIVELNDNTAVTDAAATKSSLTAMVSETRGNIYDCKKRPLVNEETELYVAIKPTLSALNAASAVIGDTDKDALFETVTAGKIALAPATGTLETDEAKTVTAVRRYRDAGLAVHLIGYINGDGEGVSGIEKYYDTILKNASGTLKATYPVDALGHILEGGEISFVAENYHSPAGVMLTLNRDIQTIAQEALEKFEIDVGAVVVLDANTAEIRAMASMPAFNQNHPEESLNAENAPFVNRAITPYSVGSVFKAVVAAAAIEKGIDTDFSYTCSGSYTIGETVFNCHNRSGHGTQDMGEAMANSCNPYFIELALETGAENVCAMGENLGLGAQIALADGFYTEPRIMPDKSSIASKQDLANLAFGQGQLLASPLQMAAVYAAIANDGIYRAPSLMQAIVDASGEEVQRAFLPVSRRAMSKSTAETVGELLHDTVENGSGKKAKPASCSAAGKTGTAQSGWINDDGTEVTQSWYCGYFPYEDPQYVVTLLKENGEGGSVDCAPVFAYIADEILKLS